KQFIVEAMESVDHFNSDALLAKFEMRSREQFLTSVAKAIEAIKDRDSASPHTSELGKERNEHQGQVVEEMEDLRNVESAKTQAWSYLDKEPVVAVFFARRGAEAIAKHLYRVLGHERSGKPAKKMTLEDLLLP